MNKPTAFITRSAARLTPRMYYAWVEYNGKEFSVGRYMTRYGALRGAVRCARELYAHEREHNEQREAVDAADIQGLPYVKDGEYVSGLQKLDDGELMY